VLARGRREVKGMGKGVGTDKVVGMGKGVVVGRGHGRGGGRGEKRGRGHGKGRGCGAWGWLVVGVRRLVPGPIRTRSPVALPIGRPVTQGGGWMREREQG
jgi:hypothetical protein